jgi:hypothetical protein
VLDLLIEVEHYVLFRVGLSTSCPAEEHTLTEPVIPYATPHRRGLTARELFGVVVRTLGLLMVLWGLYTLIYLINVRAVNAPSAGYPTGSFLITSTFWLVGGIVLLRGEWLVRFAYGGTAAG